MRHRRDVERCDHCDAKRRKDTRESHQKSPHTRLGSPEIETETDAIYSFRTLHVQYGDVWRTRYSSVFGMSRMDFTPDAMTATGVRLNSVKSALTSSATKNTLTRCKKLVFVRKSCELLVTCCQLTFVVVSVHTSDTSRHEHTDACPMRKKHGRTHCCSTTQTLHIIRTPVNCGR